MKCDNCGKEGAAYIDEAGRSRGQRRKDTMKKDTWREGKAKREAEDRIAHKRCGFGINL
jgi:hypothetical protein